MRIHVFRGLFPLGQVYTTPGALEVVSEDERISALTRHIGGDWGDVCDDDRAANDEALQTGERLLSVYHTAAGVKFWIITERDRSATTFLLPSEY